MARETVENTQAQAQGIGGANSETLHFVLDMIGLFPVVGEFADAANVLLYVSEGNYKMAMVSAVKGKPRKDRLPVSKGKWVGEPGNGEWYSDKQEVLNITKGKPVVFKDNKPDFTPLAVEELDFPKGVLTGNHGKDDRLADKWMKEKYGYKTVREATEWRESNELTFHHISDVKGQMVPRDLHKNVPHTGGAAYIRNK